MKGQQGRISQVCNPGDLRFCIDGHSSSNLAKRGSAKAKGACSSWLLSWMGPLQWGCCTGYRQCLCDNTGTSCVQPPPNSGETHHGELRLSQLRQRLLQLVVLRDVSLDHHQGRPAHV